MYVIIPILSLITMFSLLIYRLVEIYYILKSYEGFTNHQNKCNFSPSSYKPHNMDDCILKCKSDYQSDNPKNKCTYNDCQSICSEYESKNHFSPPNVEDKYDAHFNSLKTSRNDVPPHKIRKFEVTPFNGAVEVSFLKPNSVDFEITGYLYYIYKTFKRHEGVLVGKLGDDHCLECNSIITDLDPTEKYSISVRAFNNYGMGPLSNIKTFDPVEKIVAKNYHLLPAIQPIDTKNLIYCNKNN